MNRNNNNTPAKFKVGDAVLCPSNDDEVILLTSGTVSNAACEVHGAAEILDDISSFLGLIYSGKINQKQAVSLARMAQVTTDTWSEILYLQLAKLNESLSSSKFGAVEVDA